LTIVAENNNVYLYFGILSNITFKSSTNDSSMRVLSASSNTKNYTFCRYSVIYPKSFSIAYASLPGVAMIIWGICYNSVAYLFMSTPPTTTEILIFILAPVNTVNYSWI
jgi:hypothetical protein